MNNYEIKDFVLNYFDIDKEFNDTEFVTYDKLYINNQLEKGDKFIIIGKDCSIRNPKTREEKDIKEYCKRLDKKCKIIDFNKKDKYLYEPGFFIKDKNDLYIFSKIVVDLLIEECLNDMRNDNEKYDFEQIKEVLYSFSYALFLYSYKKYGNKYIIYNFAQKFFVYKTGAFSNEELLAEIKNDEEIFNYFKKITEEKIPEKIYESFYNCAQCLCDKSYKPITIHAIDPKELKCSCYINIDKSDIYQKLQAKIFALEYFLTKEKCNFFEYNNEFMAAREFNFLKAEDKNEFLKQNITENRYYKEHEINLDCPVRIYFSDNKHKLQDLEHKYYYINDVYYNPYDFICLKLDFLNNISLNFKKILEEYNNIKKK